MVATTFLMVNSSLYLAFAQEKEVLNNAESSTQEEQKSQEILNLLTGEVQSVETNNLNRVAVANPEIVDISDAKPERVFIAGKKPGQTELFIWDEDGKKDFLVRVASENLVTVKARLKEVFDKAQVKDVSMEENQYEGKLVLYGTLSKVDKELLDKIADPYADKIINLVKAQENEDLIQIDAQILEISSTFVKTLGINWQTGKQTKDATTGQYTTTGASSFTPTYLELQPQSDGSIGDYFKIGNFYRSQESALVARIGALLSEGKGRVLSKPRLVVKNGKQASFSVGGEIPIKSTTTTGATAQESVTFKSYGVSMVVTPEIKEGKIDISLAVRISDVDPATKIGEASEIAFISREAQTQLFLEDNQTIVLAGFIKHSDGNTVKRLPFLSDIPVIGALFRTRDTPRNDTEMVIILTPRILKSKRMSMEEVVLPSKRMNELERDVESNFDKESTKPPVKKEDKKAVVQAKTAEKAKGAEVPAKKIDPKIVSYMRLVQQKIASVIQYPYAATEKNWQGTVKVRMRIIKDGTLVEADILQSSGHDILDSDALNTVRTLSPYAPFSEGMIQEDIVFTTPIVYSPKKSSK